MRRAPMAAAAVCLLAAALPASPPPVLAMTVDAAVARRDLESVIREASRITGVSTRTIREIMAQLPQIVARELAAGNRVSISRIGNFWSCEKDGRRTICYWPLDGSGRTQTTPAVLSRLSPEARARAGYLLDVILDLAVRDFVHTCVFEYGGFGKFFVVPGLRARECPEGSYPKSDVDLRDYAVHFEPDVGLLRP